MMIKSINLQAFGPFTETCLNFEGSKPGLHIVYGPNEAGKSSTLRALKAWLFGFPERTTDNFLHANDRLCVLGTIYDGKGKELMFSRRKKRKASILDTDGNILDQGLIQTWLQGLDQAGFEILFGLDHAGLVKGGATILQEKGSVGTTLFSAGTGIAALEQILSDLQEERKTIFKPQGTKPELNAALKRHKELKKEINQAALASSKWKEHERNLQQAETDLKQIRSRKKLLQEQEQGLKRQQQALQPLARLREAHFRLEQMDFTPVLPEDFAKRRQDNQELLRQSEKALAGADKRLAEYRAKMDLIDLNNDLLDQAETIGDLHQRLGAHRKGLADRRKLEESRVQEEAAALAILRRVRPDLNADQHDVLQALFKQRRKVIAHGNKLEVLQKEIKDSFDTFRTRQQELESKKEELKELEADKDVSALRQAVDAGSSLGDIDNRLEKETSREASEKKAFCAGMQKLGFSWISPKELLSLPVPLESTVRQFKLEWESLKQKDQELLKTRTELTNKINDLEKHLYAQELAGDVPSEAELRAKRDFRDKGWSILRRNWLENEDVQAEIREYAFKHSLVDTYEDAVKNADHIADRLRLESARVHERARLQSEMQQAKQQFSEMEKGGAEQSAKWSDLQTRWNYAWQASKIEPDSPEVMAEWQSKIQAWQVTARQIIDLEAANARQNQRQKESRAFLEQVLKDIDISVPKGETLKPVLKLAQKSLQNIEQAAQQRKTLQKTIISLQKECDQARERTLNAEKDFKKWQEQWSTYLVELGLPESEGPGQVADFFEDLDACLKHLNKARGYAQRIMGIDQDSEDLRRDVHLLLKAVAPELIGQPVDQAVESLNGLLDRAQASATTLKNYQESIKSAENEIQEAEIDREYALAQLSELCNLAGCQEQSQLEAVEQSWRTKQELEKSISKEKETLQEIAQSYTLTELIKEVDAADPDSLPGSLQEIEEQINHLDEEIEQKSRLVGELKKSFQDMDGSDQAAQKAEQAEEVLAFISRQAERFIRLRLAATLLEQAIERYRAENQDPVLALAGQYFKELTLGSFQELRTDIDEKGEQVIVGLRDMNQRIPVEGMSDGTRDQLFLALRLASLEHRLQTSQPVPFIVDDILINFDEDRVKAALKALSRLGEKNQVLLFSHHQQVADAGHALQLGRVHRLG